MDQVVGAVSKGALAGGEKKPKKRGFSQLWTFKLPESFWNCARSILLDQEMDLEKKNIRKYLFLHEKNFVRKKNKIILRTISKKSKSENFQFAKVPPFKIL